MDDVRRITRELNDELHKRGIDTNDANIRRKVEQVASDEAMVGRMRDLINAGETINIDTYMQIRGAALDSRTALLGKDQIGPTTIEVALVHPNGHGGEIVPWRHLDELREQNAALRDENETLRTKLAALEPAS